MWHPELTEAKKATAIKYWILNLLSNVKELMEHQKEMEFASIL